MFAKIRDYVDDENVLAVIIIDEVESLTAARSQSSSEPSDAIRVVNAVLTQLDQLKNYPNVLVLTTSNVTGRIDLAFVDRADMKVFIGPPGVKAIYSILHQSATEFHTKGVITGDMTLRKNACDLTAENRTNDEEFMITFSNKFVGVSGRTLRKIPFLAHMRFIKKETCNMSEYLVAMEKALEFDQKERKDLSS